MLRRMMVIPAVVIFGLLSVVIAGEEAELEPPPDGKVVVYIGRMTGYFARSRPLYVFHDQELLGYLKGKNYVRYVCDPGENLFWVAADKRSFVKADLEAGRSYALFAKMTFGTWSAGAELRPIVEGSKAWKEYREMIGHKKSKPFDAAYYDKWNRNHPDYIRKALQEWETNGEPALRLLKDEFIE